MEWEEKNIKLTTWLIFHLVETSTNTGLSLKVSNWLLQACSNYEIIIINLRVLKMPEYIQKQMQAPFL